MGMTMTQKILAKHAGLAAVEAGELIEAKLDLVLGNDITAPIAITELEKAGLEKVFDPSKIVLVMDHFMPNKDIESAQLCKQCRGFAGKHAIAHFFDVGEMGVEHALLPERGMVGPGEVVIGADSHTCTYGALGAFSTGVGSTDMACGMASGKLWFKVPPAIKFHLTGKPAKWVGGKDVILSIIGQIGVDGALYKSMEFTGEGLQNLTVEDRLCMANMAIEAGGKNGIFEVDDVTRAYLKDRRAKPYEVYTADADAEYDAVYEIDLSTIQPVVALPHLPANVVPAAEADDRAIDQVVIGSCTNGRIEDMRAAAGVLRGRRVKKGVRCIIVPATQAVYRQAMDEGLFTVFLDAGCAISTPTCGPCMGGHMGILAEGERCVSTTNRNFVGRMGHLTSEIILAGPAVAAASAVLGRVGVPGELS
ncbi:MAG: 3-isopropylmalate dehydratase large subunit [Firmicutes bacterium]|nr:3-isopropylmalate dehydratase large subunit [Bacillota bacterium]